MFWDRHHDFVAWWPMAIGLIVWAVIIGLAVWLVVRALSQRGSASGGSAEELLRHRFANGEIDSEEYAKRLELLRRR